jgi:chloramphenicol 3-O-phosphotransferase
MRGGGGAAGWKYVWKGARRQAGEPLVIVAPEVREHLLEDTAVRQRQRKLLATQHTGHPRVLHCELVRLAEKLVDAVRLGVPGHVRQA